MGGNRKTVQIQKGPMTLGIMTFSISTLSITVLVLFLGCVFYLECLKQGSCWVSYYADCLYAECRFMLNVFMLIVVLCWMSLCWVSIYWMPLQFKGSFIYCIVFQFQAVQMQWHKLLRYRATPHSVQLATWILSTLTRAFPCSSPFKKWKFNKPRYLVTEIS